MNGRHIIIALIAGLGVLLAVLGARLPQELGSLSTADRDNAQWALFQLETEFIRLSETLAHEATQMPPDSDTIRLRADIAISRLYILDEGQYRNYWGDIPEVQHLLRELSVYEKAAIAIIDQPRALTQQDVVRLDTLTEAVHPKIRELTLLGLSLGQQASEAERRDFAEKLRRFGLVALAGIALLLATLVYMDHLLAKARKSDAELKAFAERLRATVDASLDGIVIADEAGKILDLNAAALSIFGWQKADVMERQFDEALLAAQHRSNPGTGLARFLSNEPDTIAENGPIELAAVRKTGEEFPIELNVRSANQDANEIFIAYIRDISRRKISEQKLIDARDQAERTDRAKSHFLTIMSHEMRTPLNGIIGVLDLLKTTELDKRQGRYVEVAAASGEILLEHVNEALDITRIEAGVMSLAPDVFSLRDTVLRITDVLRTLAREKGLSLTVDFDPAMDRQFYADGVRLNQILTNLIGNAIKFTQQGGITVSVVGIHGPDQTAATITVVDTGQGIRPENLEEIFEDFVALARPSGRQSRGDGLGLSISRKIARLMGGNLKADSVFGKGSVFTLTLPLARGERAPPKLQANPKAADERPRSVLIVEDNAINRSVLTEMLQGFGHAVSEAQNGRDGVAAAEKQAFDLIIMDISMPVMDGIEATKRIRTGNGRNKDTYILGLTAHGRLEYRDKARTAGMSGFSTKPLRLADLKRALDGMEAERAESGGGDTLLITASITELMHGLGREKMRATVDRYFQEYSEELALLRRQTPDSDRSAIKDRLHKLRGASVLLGLQAIVGAVDAASQTAEHGTEAEFSNALDELEEVRVVSEAAIREMIEAA